MGRSRAIGYEMSAVNPDPEEENLILSIGFTMQEAARSTDNEGNAGAEWIRVQEGFEKHFRELDEAHESCFFLDMWAMQQARRIMLRVGMLDTVTVAPPALKADDFGVDEDMMKVDYPAFPQVLTPEPLKAMQKARAAILEGAPEEPTGIIPFKLGSNDPWVITPGELTAGLRTGDQWARNRPNALEHSFPDCEFWPEWVRFMRYCATHGGMRLG